jgi:hypothetical protein
MKTDSRFNPLDTRTIGQNLMDAVLARPAESLGSLGPFTGAGIYVLYYTGEFPAYAAIAASNRGNAFNGPIYVGRAIPPGTSTGMVLAEEYRGNALYVRLVQHANSIKAASNLEINDFYCRYLVVDDVWIPLAESLLITRFAPIWNLSVAGFGNHDPGKGRTAGRRSRSDTLHPGRSWVDNFRERDETAEQIGREIAAHLRGRADLENLFSEPENGDNGSNPITKS